jgi:hypothetical protein
MAFVVQEEGLLGERGRRLQARCETEISVCASMPSELDGVA